MVRDRSGDLLPTISFAALTRLEHLRRTMTLAPHGVALGASRRAVFVARI